MRGDEDWSYIVQMPISKQKDPIHRFGDIIRKCKEEHEIHKNGKLVMTPLQQAEINDFDIKYIRTHNDN